MRKRKRGAEERDRSYRKPNGIESEIERRKAQERLTKEHANEEEFAIEGEKRVQEKRER